MINPMPCPWRAGASVRIAVEAAGKGCWKKQMPSRNRTDRRFSPPRKWADFQRVVSDEKTGRTCSGRNCKWTWEFPRVHLPATRSPLFQSNWNKGEHIVTKLQAHIVKSPHFREVLRLCFGRAFHWLEPDEGKLSSPVLRGGVASNGNSLPDPSLLSSFPLCAM